MSGNIVQGRSTFPASGYRPVLMHLDHGYSFDDCAAAIEAGFTSVMFDGSRMPLKDNIAQTRAIADFAHQRGVSVEGEIGFAGYSMREPSNKTDPDQAARFAAETGVDAMAISIGNVHLQENREGSVELGLLRRIERATSVPLVLHGGSGLPPALRLSLANTSNICKFNIGTEVRRAFGQALRTTLAADPDEFDRVAILKQTLAPVREATRVVLSSLGSERARSLPAT